MSSTSIVIDSDDITVTGSGGVACYGGFTAAVGASTSNYTTQFKIDNISSLINNYVDSCDSVSNVRLSFTIRFGHSTTANCNSSFSSDADASTMFNSYVSSGYDEWRCYGNETVYGSLSLDRYDGAVYFSVGFNLAGAIYSSGFYLIKIEDMELSFDYTNCSVSNVNQVITPNQNGSLTVSSTYSSSGCECSAYVEYRCNGDYIGSGSSATFYPTTRLNAIRTEVNIGNNYASDYDNYYISYGSITASDISDCSAIKVKPTVTGLSSSQYKIAYRIKESSSSSWGAYQTSSTFSSVTAGVLYDVEAALFMVDDSITTSNRVDYYVLTCSRRDLGWSQDLVVYADGIQMATVFEIGRPVPITMSAVNTCGYNTVYQYSFNNQEWATLSGSSFTPTEVGTYKFRAYVTDYDFESSVYSCTLLEPTFSVVLYSEDTGIDSGAEVYDGDSLNVFESSSNKVVISHTSSWDASTTGTHTYDVNGANVSSFYVNGSTVYSITTGYTIGRVTNTVSFTVLGLVFTNGTIVCGSDELCPGTGVAIDKTAGESLVIIAQGWGSGNNTYEFAAYQTSLSGTNPVALSPDNGVLNGTGLSSTKILIPYSTEYGYKVALRVSSTDDIGRVRGTNGYIMSSSWFTCSVGIVPVVTLLPDPHVGGINTEFTGDASKSFVRGYDFTLSYQWGLYENGVLVNDMLSTSDLTSSGIVTLINAVGNYELRCTISGTYEDGALDPVTVSLPVSIKEIIQTGINDFNRFALVINNSEKSFVITRKRPPYFTELTFEKSLANIGSLSCKLTGVSKDLEDVLHKPGAYITLLDRMNPVWIGVITEPCKVNNNMYNKTVSVVQYNITAYEATKVLALEYIPNNNRGLLSGTITEVAESIIPPKYHGSIGVSSVNYGISLSNTSRLTALDSLYNQAGWRYRCRPNTLEFWEDYVAGNVLSGYNDTAMVVHYSNGQYTCGFANNFSSDVDGKVTIYDEFLIDFRPSYYQTYDTRDFVINYDARNVNEIDNIRDKFGTAIVYGVGYSGESIASSMKAWMPINKDYTIDNSMRITKSYDSEIDSVIKLDEVTYNGHRYSRYVITMNGWSFPDFSTLPRLKSYTQDISIKPRVYFVNSSNKLHYIELDYDDEGPNPPEPNPRRYYDQANNKKTAYTVCIDQNDTASDNSTKVTSVIESLVPLSNIIFPVFAVDYPMSLPDVGDEICVGDMVCNVRYKNNTYNEVVVDYKVSADDWQSNGIPHGHYTDVLVMDNSGEYNQSNPHPNSPYSQYPNTSLTTQGPEGYTIMEMERLACRYMQYGSNYSAEGTSTVSAVFFNREDYEFGTARIPMVGDRIGIKSMSESGEWVVNQFELQKYVFKHDNYSVEMTFGMPILNLGEIIYNMMSNSGMSIIPADS